MNPIETPSHTVVGAPPSTLVVEHRGHASPQSQVAAAVFRRSVRPLAALAIHYPPSLPGVASIERIAAGLRPPRGTRTRRVTLGTCGGEWVIAPGTGGHRRVVLYFHGGVFIAGGLHSHRRLVARISEAAGGAAVLNVDYRLMPRVQLTDIVADGLAAYRWLLERGTAADDIVIAGDSAGGFLTFAVALAARDADLPMPAGLVALSPMTDLDHTAKRAHPNAALDPFIPPEIAVIVDRYIALDGTVDPALSPVNADLRGLPPVLIQVGSTETLLVDAEAMAERLAAAGVPCRLQIWDRQLHVFQAGADLLPEGRAAIAEIGAFIDTATRRPR